MEEEQGEQEGEMEGEQGEQGECENDKEGEIENVGKRKPQLNEKGEQYMNSLKKRLLA